MTIPFSDTPVSDSVKPIPVLIKTILAAFGLGLAMASGYWTLAMFLFAGTAFNGAMLYSDLKYFEA